MTTTQELVIQCMEFFIEQTKQQIEILKKQEK